MSFPPQFEAPSPEELHELLPAYDVLAFIAKGGMGAVYKARQKSLERDVAIKILPREFGEDEDFRRRFEDEAKAMAKLNHPNLISVYDFGEVDQMPYIVMEFVDGKSLHHSAHGKAIEQKEVARLVTGICEGLAHAHEAGILHRDIKPANILLDSKKRPKIGDFGLARFADESEGEGIIFGTPDYTAPEVVKNPRSVDTRSDVFSTGVILYELLTGKVPEKTYVPASQIEDVDPRFDKIVRRATHPSPMLRFADGDAMTKDIKALSEALDKQVPSIISTPPITQPVETAPPAATAPVPATGPVPPPAAGAPAFHPAPPPEPNTQQPAPAAVEIKVGTNWSLLRNLIIIVVLLAAIFGMYKAYQWKQADEALKKKEQQRRADLEEQERLTQEREERKARERREALMASQPKDPETVQKPEPEPETPLEALERLQPALAAGERDEYPPGTLVRGTSRFFLVENKLSWQRASAFAETYGGHLATCLSEGEKNWLASKIPSDTTIWLGGGATGRTSWGWVDGTPWTVRTPSATTGNCASLSDLGSIRSQPGGRKFAFYIQWRHDGTNPGALKAQMTRLKASLNSPDPVYPPGVLSFENRRYLVIEKSLRWEEAASMAQGAHGHLAVPSEPSEDNYLRALINATLDESAAAWIGGRHDGRSWTWITDEPWSFAAWAPGSPDGEKSTDNTVRLVAGEKGGWDDGNPSDAGAAAAFIIEWSKDRGNTNPVVITSAAGDWGGLRVATQKKLQILEASFTEKVFENGKGLKWDLNFWHRGLRSNDEQIYAPVVDQIKQKVKKDGSITVGMTEQIKLPPRGVEIVKKHLHAQLQLRDSLEAQANRIRADYVQNLQTRKETAEGNGKNAQMTAIQNEIDACGDTGRTFLDHLGSGAINILDSPRTSS